MRLRPANFNTMLSPIDVEEATEVLNEAVSIIEEVYDFMELLVPDLEYENSHPGEDLKQEQLDTLDGLSLSIEYSNLEMFAEGMFSASESTQRRITNAVHYLAQFKERIKAHAEAYIYLTTEEVEVLKELANNILAELAYFTFFEFELDKTADTIIKKAELEVNIVVHRYTDMQQIPIEHLLISIQRIMKIYRPVLGLFEQYPELEEEFYNVAGPYIKDFEVLTEYVTLDMVKGVISGSLDVETVITDLEQKLSHGDA
jgi:hypothetical protein